MAAAQLMRAARAEMPALDAGFAAGDLSPLNDWLHRNIHAHGSRLGFNDLLTAATGSALTVDAFEVHLTERYLT